MPKENHELEFGWNLHDQIARYDRGGSKGTPYKKIGWNFKENQV